MMNGECGHSNLATHILCTFFICYLYIRLLAIYAYSTKSGKIDHVHRCLKSLLLTNFIDTLMHYQVCFR